jgi:hypothetical protein
MLRPRFVEKQNTYEKQGCNRGIIVMCDVFGNRLQYKKDRNRSNGS